MKRTLLKKLREEKGYTLKKLSDKVGYGTGNLSSYETGKLKLKDATMLRILTRGFDMTEAEAREYVAEWRKQELQDRYGDILAQNTEGYNQGISKKEVLQFLRENGLSEEEVEEVKRKLK